MAAESSFRPLRLLLPLLCAAATTPPPVTVLIAPATASAPPPAAVDALARMRLAAANDPAEILARYLRTLATDPHDLEALTGAGRAALDIGDANAALAFYARAEELAPRNGRIKAGIASALVQLQKPKEAIRLFDEATGLGVPESDVARDRGLAWDLRGDGKRAQKYYALALQARADDETVRRLALSTAISGDSEAAALLLDPLLRRNDPAAWRARAFIHAMNGDIASAERVARSAMSAAQVAALRPFLVRLASLKPAQKAMAVTFGEMPADGRTYSPTELAALDGPPPRPAAAASPSALIPAGDPFGRRAEDAPAARPIERLSTAPRRRPGEADAASAAPPPARPAALALASPPPRVAISLPPLARPVATIERAPVAAAPAALAAKLLPAAETKPAAPAAATAAAQPGFAFQAASPAKPVTSVSPSPSIPSLPPGVVAPAAAPAPPATVLPTPIAIPPLQQPAAAPATATRPVQTAAIAATPAPIIFSLTPRRPAPTSLAAIETSIAASVKAEAGAGARQAPVAKSPPPAEAKPASAKTVAVVEKKVSDEKKVPDEKNKDEKKTDGKKGDAKAKPAERKGEGDRQSAGAAPERVWVQVAGGATKADLPKAWAKLKGKTPPLAKGQSATTTPLRFTNRLLVGPFKTADDAQAYVNRMSKSGLSGFVFTSAKGQKVEQLPAAKK